MKRSLLFLSTCVLLLFPSLSAQEEHKYDELIQTKVEHRLAQRKKELPHGNLFAPLNKKMSSEEQRAMRFLYAYMPLSDIADYTGDFHLQAVRSALQARREMPWGQQVTLKDFYHFVLPTRVNNEALDSARQVLYPILKKRIMHLPLEKAIIEVNRWCHEHVTYAPSDARTSSPLATIRSAYGRCGEESTLLVTALRAVGIPARQVYTPRWAHTDDNHAWVEAQVNGVWRFLGACEPEPVLNLGWFNAPVSRAMLVHTRVFGDYEGSEPMISKNKCVTEINVTNGYAPVSFAEVEVVDEAGKPVSGAQVEFKVYNYGEFYSVGKERSNTQGLARFLAGHGDMLVWASTHERFGFAKVSFARQERTQIVLRYTANDTIHERIDITPPFENPRYPKVSEQERQENTRLLAYEDSLRNSYVATFLDKQMEGLDARGNWATLRAFVQQSKQPKQALALLSLISAKDRRDVSLSNLNDHLYNTKPKQEYVNIDSALVWQYIYSPRVSLEEMSPYKGSFARLVPQGLQSKWRHDIRTLIQWCQNNLRLDNESNPHRYPIQPMGVWRSLVGDNQSLAIFFVSMARAMGHPARLDAVTGKIQYYSLSHQDWVDVHLFQDTQSQQASPKGQLYLDYQYNGIVDNPRYYSHFSISRFLPNNTLSLQSYDLADRGLEQGASWAGFFGKGVTMDAGNYLLVTGSRMASGNVLAELKSFTVTNNTTTRVPLVMRRDSTQVAVIGGFDAESKYLKLGDISTLRTQAQLLDSPSQESSILSTTGRGYYILGILSSQHEPSNHALRDLSALNETLKSWGRPMLLLFANEEQRRRYRPEEFANLPNGITWGIDKEGAIRESLIKEFKLNQQELPIFIIADTFNRVVYVKQGYTIGLGEQLKAIIAGLRESNPTATGACTLP